jgi:hypothetical protein
MTTITAKHILSSVGAEAPPIRSLQLRYPLVIHAELMTHRVFSRNARSSRAVPVARMIEEVMTDPYIPLVWDRNQKGMQGADGDWNETVWLRSADRPDLQTPDDYNRRDAWLWARDRAVEAAKGFADAEYSKQICNRLLAPFLHIDVLVTSTNFSNWEALRIHPAAEPHIRMLAEAMRDCIKAAPPPDKLGEGIWHLPYITPQDWIAARERAHARIGKRPWSMTVGEWMTHKAPFFRQAEEELRKISVARCAQISYIPFSEGANAAEKEIAKHDMLAENGHWSPFEHQATPDAPYSLAPFSWRNPHLHGNLTGWCQLRKFYKGEYR